MKKRQKKKNNKNKILAVRRAMMRVSNAITAAFNRPSNFEIVFAPGFKRFQEKLNGKSRT